MLADIEAKLTEVKLPQPETRLKFQGESERMEQLIFALGGILEEAVPVIPQYQQMERIVAVREEGNPHGLAINDTSNHIYIAEGWNGFARASIISESGDFLNSFTHERMEEPWGIAFHRNNVYVTDTEVHGMSTFNTLAALLDKGSTDGMFNYPRQLTVSDNEDLYIADSKNHRIQILDESLPSNIPSLTNQCDILMT